MVVDDEKTTLTLATKKKKTGQISKFSTPPLEWVPSKHCKKLNKLMKVESLGDRIVSLGYNSPMIVMVSDFEIAYVLHTTVWRVIFTVHMEAVIWVSLMLGMEM